MAVCGDTPNLQAEVASARAGSSDESNDRAKRTYPKGSAISVWHQRR